jgi:hypothetical protein
MRSLLIAAAALAATAVPAAAQNVPGLQTRDNGGADQRAADDNPDRRICVSVELTGSRMVRRVCRTAREWEARGGLETVR